MRTRSHSPAPIGPRLSRIAFEIPSRPRPCTRPARRTSCDIGFGQPEPRARLGGELGDRSARDRGSTATSGRRSWRSPEARRRSARPSTRWRAQARRRSRRPTRRPCPGPRGSRPPPHRRGRPTPGRSRLRSVPAPAACTAATPPRRFATSMNSAMCAIREASGTSSPSSSPGQPRPSHRSYEAPIASRTSVGQRRAARPCVRAMAAWWAIMPSTSRCPESANARPSRKRCSGGCPEPRAACPSRPSACSAARGRT